MKSRAICFCRIVVKHIRLSVWIYLYTCRRKREHYTELPEAQLPWLGILELIDESQNLWFEPQGFNDL